VILFSFLSGKRLPLYLYFIVAVLDAYSQITGQLFGRHKLAPAISPAKTVEGSLGGILFTLIVAVIMRGLVDFTVVEALGAGIIASVFGITGDLGASWFKRRAGVKDYSSILPGQGGFVDRFNSFIATCVWVWIYTVILG
jgi:phosphatidate cytidylyltransferase